MGERPGSTSERATGDSAEVAAAASVVAGAARVVVLTGAGISTGSGIPDFRGPQGLWTRDPAAEKLSSIDHYLADPEVRRLAWRSRGDSPAWTATPNSGHRALVALERQGRLGAIVTQNIDGLHQRAGNDPERVVEVHGTIWFTRCLTCGDRRSMDEALTRVAAGEDDPPCRVCGGIIKSDTISFGQSLVPAVIDRAFAETAACDVFLAVGSTLSVYPVAGCVPVARRAGATVVIVNGSPTEQDDAADVVVRGEIGAVLPAIIGSGDPP